MSLHLESLPFLGLVLNKSNEKLESGGQDGNAVDMQFIHIVIERIVTKNWAGPKPQAFLLQAVHGTES